MFGVKDANGRVSAELAESIRFRTTEIYHAPPELLVPSKLIKNDLNTAPRLSVLVAPVGLGKSQ